MAYNNLFILLIHMFPYLCVLLLFNFFLFLFIFQQVLFVLFVFHQCYLLCLFFTSVICFVCFSLVLFALFVFHQCYLFCLFFTSVICFVCFSTSVICFVCFSLVLFVFCMFHWCVFILNVFMFHQQHAWCLIRSNNCLPFTRTRFWCCSSFSVLWCVLFVFVQCLVCPIFPLSLGYPFLSVPSVFSNVYLFIMHNLIVIFCLIEFTPCFQWSSCYSFSVQCFGDRCLSFWPLCCLSFFDLRILITHLVSVNSSYVRT